MAEKEYTIHFNNLVRIPRTRYANKAIYALRGFVQKHTHAENSAIRVSSDVNHEIWKRGKQSKPTRMKIILKKKENEVWVFTPNGNDLKEYEKTLAASTAKKGKPSTKTDETKEKTATKEEGKNTTPSIREGKKIETQKKEIKPTARTAPNQPPKIVEKK